MRDSMRDLWSQLGTCSRRAISRRRKQFGHPYVYRPRGSLLARLAAENHISIEEAYRQLMELRQKILADQNPM